MRVTDVVSITELAKLLNKSRPTVYKYISDYENGEADKLPATIQNLFTRITKGELTKRDLYDYCSDWFTVSESASSKKDEKTARVDLKDVIKLLKANQNKIDFSKLKTIIEEEIKR